MYQQLKQKKFSKLPFKLTLAATAICGVMSANVFAAEEAEDEEDVEVIEVRGVRGNMMKAQDMKREGDTFLDAISAADIGSLPDRSVLEAISRVPGVSIERFAGANDPDHFGVEGSGVVVRGLTHVRSEFNGRDTFTADSGRGLSFQDVPPELMGSVEVFKNQTADMIEGGIAGTVNLITRKPFDTNERIVAFTLDATHSDFIKETTPSFSALYSDVFDTDTGKFGVLINFADSELKAQSDATQMGQPLERVDSNGDGTGQFIPQTIRINRKRDDRERQGLALALQWESPDETIVATAEYIRSESSLAWNENAIAGSPRTEDLTQSPRDPRGTDAEPVEFEYGEDGLFENGLIATHSWWRGRMESDRDPHGKIFGTSHVASTRYREQDSVVEDLGFNLKITPNDSLEINLDAQYIDSKAETLDFEIGSGTRAVVGIDRRNGINAIDFYAPSYSGEAIDDNYDSDFFQNPHNYYFRSAMPHIADNEGNELSLQADVKYHIEDSFFTSAKVGARYANREQITRQSIYDWKVISEGWNAGGQKMWFDKQDPSTYQEVEFNNFARNDVFDVVGSDEKFLFPSHNLVQNYRDAYSVISNMVDDTGTIYENPNAEEKDLKTISQWAPLSARDGAVGDFIANEINDTEETSTALYAMLSFESEVADLTYAGNFGLRYVKLENNTAGFLTYPDNADDTTFNNNLPQQQRDFGNKASMALSAESDYDVILPSFNLKLDLSDDLIMRLGFSKAIALPDLGLLRNNVSISGDSDEVIEVRVDKLDDNGDKIPVLLEGEAVFDPETGEQRFEQTIDSNTYGRYTASSGNPYLKPMESYNYDVSLEWYFSEAGSLTTSLFYKELSNYFINGVTQREYTNNGVTQLVDVSGATNGDKGKVTGFEIAYSQFFDFLPDAWSGLGMQFNYTYIDEEGSPNSNLSADAPTSSDPSHTFDLPLEGLSKDNYNIVAMYEKNGWNARIAYNWRSRYLLTSNEVNLKVPVFNDDMGQVDGSVFYDINENFTIGLQGTNLTNSEVETLIPIDKNSSELNLMTRALFVNDRRYSLILKGTF